MSNLLPISSVLLDIPPSTFLINDNNILLDIFSLARVMRENDESHHYRVLSFLMQERQGRDKFDRILETTYSIGDNRFNKNKGKFIFFK